MLRKISNSLLALSIFASLGFMGWRYFQWQEIAKLESAVEAAVVQAFEQDYKIVLAMLGILLVGYFLSFDSRRAKRPFFLILSAAFLVGASAGVAVRESLSGYSVITDPLPKPDLILAGLLLAAGAVPCLAIVSFEAINRAIWTRTAKHFDEKKKAGVAIAATRLSLLFKPGQTAMLRTVALASFRKGNRGEAVQTILNLYKSGKKDPEILEALCKYSSEQHDSKNYLRFLRELHEMLPQEHEIREVLIEELIGQNLHSDALEVMEKEGFARNEQGLVRYANTLLSVGRIEATAEVARELGDIEGIPFRQSQKLLREILSKRPNLIDAINLLAAQAERMALREQRIRWLERSLEAEPNQPKIRAQLLSIYRELGQTVRLETILSEVFAENPEDNDILYELVQVLHQNDKLDEATERLHQLTSREDAPVKAHMLRAQISFEEQKWEESRHALLKCLDRNPSDDEERKIHTLLAKIEKAVLTAEVAGILDEARAQPGDIELQFRALGRLVDGGHADKVVGLADQILSRHTAARPRVIEALREYARREEVPFTILNLLADLLAASNQLDEALTIVQMMSTRAIDKIATIREGTQKILRKSPHHLPTLRALGDAYLQHGRFTEMIHSYSLYLSQGGEETEQIDRALAKAYISLGDYENARRFANQLLKLDPRDTKLIKQLIPIALEAGQPEDAAEYIKNLEIIDARDPDLKKLKVGVDVGLGERRFAFLQREQEAGKGGPEVLEQLGDIAMTLSNFADAITYFQRASRDRERPALQRRCTAKLALAYMKKHLDDLCSDTLRDITISLDDDPAELDTIMAILYDIGTMMESNKLFDKADKVFKQICKIDAGYRDVLAKVEGLRM